MSRSRIHLIDMNVGNLFPILSYIEYRIKQQSGADRVPENAEPARNYVISILKNWSLTVNGPFSF